MKRRGFTLIELLVVIAIIGLLISILVPALARARHYSKRAVCASNMRGLMQAVYLYANDNEDRLVSAGLSHGGSGNVHAAWINTLRKHYGGNKLIARCPSDDSVHWEVPIAPVPVDTSDQHDGEAAGLPNEPILRQTSYGTNYYTVARIGGRRAYNQISMIQRPATTVHMVELAEEGPFATSDHVHPETWWSNPETLPAEEMELARHLEKADYSFFDGHVASHLFEETYSIDMERSSFRKIFWNRNFYDPAIGR